MRLRSEPGLSIGPSGSLCQPTVIDAGLRAYMRSFAVPVVALAALGAAFLLAMWLLQVA